MKHIAIFLILIIVSSCKPNYKKSDFIGTWECVSVLDLKTKELTFPENDEKFFAVFKTDSVYLIEKAEETDNQVVYSWKVETDTLVLDNLDSFYIKELTNNSLIVEYYFWKSMLLLTLKKD